MIRAVAVLAVLAAAPAARADDCNERETGEAFELFQQGRKLIEAGKPDEACVKFEASIKKDPRAVGTLLNLGLCNEQRGKIGTALHLYEEALGRATEAGLTQQATAAHDKIVALSPQVPIATVAFGTPPAAGTKLVIDNALVGTDARELPLDPGHHDLSLSAPGRLPFQFAFDIAKAEHRTIALPELQTPQTRIVETSDARFYGKLVIGAGAALLVGGSGLALWERHQYNAQFPGNCGGARPPINGMPSCDVEGREATDRARTYGNVATVIGGVGIAAVIAGAIIVWRSPLERTTIVPTASADHVGATLVGTF